MFKYRFVNNDLYIQLPNILKFNFDFHYSISVLIQLTFRFEFMNRLIVWSDTKVHYEKMCKAYLCNVLDYFESSGISVYVNRNFKINVMEAVIKGKSSAYKSEFEIEKLVTGNSLKYYSFNSEKEFYKPVNDIVKTISELSLAINNAELKDFLTTTIGEIFSNSINHSQKDEGFFIFDVIKDNSDFYLYISIIDYGKTIIHNVKDFFKDETKPGKSCMSWAIESGNTTRQGSGGYGLDMLIKYIKAVKGTLIIFSGDAYYILKNNGEVIIDDSKKGYFCGTSVTFKIKLFDVDNLIIFEDDTVNCISLDDLK